jgi:hypothetical protein
MTSLQDNILQVLIRYADDRLGDPQVTIAELRDVLCRETDPKVADSEIWQHLWSLQEKKWLTITSTESGKIAVFSVTAQGRKAGRNETSKVDKEDRASGESEKLGSDVDSSGNQNTPLVALRQPPSVYLEDLIRDDESCAMIVQRAWVIDRIRSYFGQEPPRHFIVLYGQPLVGKTRLLIHLPAMLGPGFVPILVTVQGAEVNGCLTNLDNFAFDLANQIANGFNRWARSHALRQLARPSLSDFRDAGAYNCFRGFWQDVCTLAGDQKPLLLIDELEALLEKSVVLDSRILAFLDGFLCNPNNGYFILAGSERIRQSSHERFHGIIAKAEPIQVGHYSSEEVRYVLSAIQNRLAIDQSVLQYLMALCNGHPRLLQIIIETIAQTQTEGVITRQVGEDNVLNRIVEEVMNRLEDHLIFLCKRLSDNEAHTLWLMSGEDVLTLASSDGYDANTLLQRSQPTIDRDELLNGLANLSLREWIEITDQAVPRFRIRLGILPFWINRRRRRLHEIRLLT